MKKYLGIIVLSILCIICTILLFSEIISFNNPSKESNAKVFEDKAIKVNNNVTSNTLYFFFILFTS